MDISKKTGIHKMTVHRMLSTFLDVRILEKNSAGKYRIGPELYILGSLYLKTTDLSLAAESVTRLLNDLTDEAINISIYDKGFIAIIVREEAKSAIKFDAHIGTIIPAYGTAMGKALLSELNESELEIIFPNENLEPITSKTISTITELKKELEKVKENGFASAREESFEGVDAVGVVIRNSSGKAVGAMSIAFPMYRIDENKFRLYAELVKLGARLISYRLGYIDPDTKVYQAEEIRSWYEQQLEHR